MNALLLALALSGTATSADMLTATGGVAGRGLGPVDPDSEVAQQVDAGDWAGASRSWREVAADPVLSPQIRARAHLWAAVSQAHLGRHSDAQAELLGAMVLDPRDPRSLLVAAWLLTEVGGARSAVRLLRGFPTDHPDAAGAEVLRMRAWTMEGRPRQALKVRAAAEEAGRTDAWFWLEAGMEAAFRGDPEALVLLERSARTEGAQVLHHRVYLRLLLDVGMLEEAAAVAIGAINRFGEDPELMASLDTFLRQPGAAERFVEALPADGVPLVLVSTLGTWFWQEGEPDHAAPLLAQASKYPDAPVRLMQLWARSVDATEGPAAATDILLSAVGRHPEHEPLREALTDAALRSRDSHRVRQAAELLGEAAPLRLALAAHELFLEEGDGTAALRWARAAGGAGLPAWDAARLEARALALLGQGNEALAAYEAGLRSAPDDPQLLGDFAQFLLAPPEGVAAQPDRARRLAERALREAGGDDSRFLGVLAEACWETGDRARALLLQQRAVDLSPTDSELTGRLHRYEAGRP